MIKFDKFKLEMPLVSWSPMIHFQAEQTGCTLRASEVKPKLDKFLLEKLKKRAGIKEIKRLKEEYPDIFQDCQTSDNHNSLDYKMSIYCSKPPKVSELNPYRIYYGDKKQKKAVFSEPVVSVVCFQKQVRELLEEFIEEFFLVTNFGTMQSKGFGSFGPKNMGKNLQVGSAYFKKVVKALEEASGGKCYYIDYGNYGTLPKERAGNLEERLAKMFEDILNFYGIMKSGRNMKGDYVRSYIYQYMHHQDPVKNIDNEKAFLKAKGLAPKASLKCNKNRGESSIKNPKYVRALLGTASAISFLQPAVNGDGVDFKAKKRIIKIEHKGKALDRVSSPILFKVVADKVFIAAFPVPEELWNQEFVFSSKDNGGVKREKLLTPCREEFDIHDFLKQYVEFFNSNELRNNDPSKPSHVKTLIRERKVQECL